MLTVETTNSRLQAFIAEDRVRPRLWHRMEAGGREVACLLGALDPSITSASMCPEVIMPPWMAHFTVFATDNVSPIFFPTLVMRFGAAYPRFPLISPTGWRRCLAKTMIKSLMITVPHDWRNGAGQVIELWTRVKNGDEPSQQDWAEAVAAVAEEAVAAKAADTIILAWILAIEDEIKLAA